MFQSIYSSESGIMAHQTGFDVISNNLSNISTAGFKKYDVTFEEMFNKTYNIAEEGKNPMQVGVGGNTSSVRRILTDGPYQSTTNILDLAIVGNGYFVLNNNEDDETYYSKVGRFNFDPGEFATDEGFPQVDSDGKIKYYLGDPALTTPMNLVNSDGAIVQGWMADGKGVVNSSGSQTDVVIDADKFLMPSSETSKLVLENNIDSTLTITKFNESQITLSQYNSIDLTETSTEGLISLRGNSLDNREGEYEVSIYTDGSATVKFYPAGVDGVEIKEYEAGTISTTATSNITNTELIPGIEMTIGSDISSPILAKISNSGLKEGETYNTEAVVYDETGQAHNLLFSFNRVEQDQWVWEARLYEIETFSGTGNATTFALDDAIDTEKEISVTLTDNISNTTTEITMRNISIIEGNKIIVDKSMGESQTAQVSYYSKTDGSQKTANFTSNGVAESFVLDNIPDADSLQIYIDGSTYPIPDHYYEIHNNVIVPVDLDGDGVKDEPFVGAGQDVTIKYISADAITTAFRTNKDKIDGTGSIATIALANEIDTSASTSIVVTNNETGATRTLSLNDFNVEGNLLKPKDKDNDGVLDSPIIQTNETMEIQYTAKDNPINQVETIVYDGSTKLQLSGQPRPNTLSLYDENNELISSDTYVVANDEVVFIDSDTNGFANLPGTQGMKIKAVYDIDFPEKINLNFNGTGEVAGGTSTAQLKFNTKDALTINIDMSNLFQFAGYSDAYIANVDGNAQGFLKQLAVDEEGKILGYYTNDITQNIAQVALATFDNPQDLTSVGENYLKENSNSGTAKVSAPGKYSSGGAILSRKIEMSNVSLAEEFSNLIILQRGFQLNSRGITTSDDMIQQAVAMKRS